PRDLLPRVRAETTRIHRIIQDLLGFARAGDPAAGSARVELAGGGEPAVALCRPQARFRDVAVEVALPGDLPAVSAVGERLQQVLVNLLLNAADAMDSGG